MNLNGFLARLRPTQQGSDPVRTWLLLFALALIMFAGIVGWNVWAFNTVVNGGTIGALTIDAPEAPSQTLLEDIQKVLTHRAGEREKYVSGDYRFSDPSQ